MTNKNFKLIALDVDGTLIRSDHVLTARTLRDIRNAKDVGIKVTIATGRQNKSYIRLAQKLQINAPLICSDGAIISDIYSNDTIYHFLPKKIAIDVLKMALDHKNLKIQVFTKDKRIFVGPNYRRVYLKRFLHFPFKYSLRGFII